MKSPRNIIRVENIFAARGGTLLAISAAVDKCGDTGVIKEYIHEISCVSEGIYCIIWEIISICFLQHD